MSSKQIPSPIVAIVDQNGRMHEIFRRYLQGLDADQVAQLSNMPPPVVGTRCYIVDATGGGPLGIPAYADGVNWRRYSDNSVIV